MVLALYHRTITPDIQTPTQGEDTETMQQTKVADMLLTINIYPAIGMMDLASQVNKQPLLARNT